MKRILYTFLFTLVFLCNTIGAQTADSTSLMRSDGKLYVVVGVIVMIFVGIVLFLIYLERKLTSLENQIKTNE
ncbi:MAG: CcmD family protein [Saprospiraceae bacterium]